ncbi:MAG TPA: hypothetical protein VGI60_12730 [Chthoniobacterales bacterium]|jgi:hypothetical protein
MSPLESPTIDAARIFNPMNNSQSIVQIVPYPLSHRGGVNDYARVLAASLASVNGLTTDFVTGLTLSESTWRPSRADAAILHYVNYGYHPRGIPFWLPKRVSEMRQSLEGPLITIFHELYASSGWHRSAFWLQPLQKRLARLVAQSSVICVVSSNLLANQLRKLLPSAPVVVRPVFSTFGEPRLSREQIASRDPERWVTCGGTELIRRSLRSFPGGKDLVVIGGEEQEDIRRQLKDGRYWPDIEAAPASERLATCAFGWMDYFAQTHVKTEAILKSTAFAAYCAHGVIPVFFSVNSKISLDGDVMPGPFTLATLPTASERPAIAEAIYNWYQRNASSAGLAAAIAKVIQL